MGNDHLSKAFIRENARNMLIYLWEMPIYQKHLYGKCPVKCPENEHYPENAFGPRKMLLGPGKIPENTQILLGNAHLSKAFIRKNSWKCSFTSGKCPFTKSIFPEMTIFHGKCPEICQENAHLPKAFSWKMLSDQHNKCFQVCYDDGLLHADARPGVTNSEMAPRG